MDVFEKSLKATDELLEKTSIEDLEKIYHKVTGCRIFNEENIGRVFQELSEEEEALMEESMLLVNTRSHPTKRVFRIDIGHMSIEDAEELVRELKVSLNSKNNKTPFTRLELSENFGNKANKFLSWLRSLYLQILK